MRYAFKAGSKVQLRTGGPIMTVIKTNLPLKHNSLPEDVTVSVYWIADKKVKTARYNQDLLVTVSP